MMRLVDLLTILCGIMMYSFLQRHREGVSAGEVQLVTVLPKEVRADSGVPNRISAHINIASSAFSLGWYRCAVDNGEWKCVGSGRAACFDIQCLLLATVKGEMGHAPEVCGMRVWKCVL